MRILSFFIAIIITIGLAPIQPVVAAEAGDLVSCPDFSSVYYLAHDGTRWVFPNEATFFTWFENFDSVVEITCEELASYDIGELMTYRPGTRLVKIQSLSPVYAVEPGGILRWVVNQSQAENLYGEDWNQRVDDVPDGLWSSYTEGYALPEDEYPTGTILQSNTSSRYFYVRSDDSLGGVNVSRLDSIRQYYAVNVSHNYIDSILGIEVGDDEWGQVEVPEQEGIIEELTEDEEAEVLEMIEEAEAEEAVDDVPEEAVVEEEPEEVVEDEPMEVELVEEGEETPACWEQTCFGYGDLNGDCVVSSADLLMLTEAINQNNQDACFDVSQDGTVSAIDSLSIINNINLNVQCPAECISIFAGLGETCGTEEEINCESGLICNTVDDEVEAEGICEDDDSWHSREVLVETDHPYDNNVSETFVITVPRATQIKAYFSEFETEDYYDQVWLTDNPLVSWSGDREPFWTSTVSGDTISIEFTSDSMITDHGFIISEIEYFR